MNDAAAKEEKVTLGGGCFWCLEGVFQEVKGVKKVVSGYSGGRTLKPSYKDVCTGTTGHAEVVQITYESSVISFRDLLNVFWHVHDPTTLNRQGNDVGSQYRSVIFYTSDEQKKMAEQSLAEAQKNFSGKIVTEIAPLKEFYEAESYHQNYFKNNPSQGYCQMIIAPKVEKFKKNLREYLK